MALDQKLKDAINNIHSHAASLQAVIDLAAAVDSIATLEQMASEAEARRRTATDDWDSVVHGKRAELDEASAALEAVKLEAAEILASSKAEAARLVDEGRAAGEGSYRTRLADFTKELDALNDQKRAAQDGLKVALDAKAEAEKSVADLDDQATELEARVRAARDFLSNLKV